MISGFRKRRVFLVGDVMVDRFLFGKVSRISPDAPVPVVDVSAESDVPGGAANVAAVLGVAGARVFASGVVGNDDAGRFLKSVLVKGGIDARGIVVDRHRPTTLKTRVVAHSQHVVRVDRESVEEVGKSVEGRILRFFSKVVRDVDGVVVSDYCKGVVSSRFFERLLSVARKHGKSVVVNTKAGNVLCFGGVDVLLVGLDEASLASGIRPVNETSVRNMGNKLVSMLGCGSVVIMRGKLGFSVSGSDGSFSTVRAPDFGGVYEFRRTGDTALGFLSLGLFSGLGVVDAAKLSSYAVEVLAGKANASMITLEDLREAFLSKPLV